MGPAEETGEADSLAPARGFLSALTAAAGGSPGVKGRVGAGMNK